MAEPARTTGTGAWVYLGLLGVVAVVLVAVAALTGGDEPRPSPVVAGAVQPVELVLRVDGATVGVEGRVPRAEVRDQLLALARARYGASVRDGLVVDGATTLEGGAVEVAGSTVAGDPHPVGLQADVVAAFLLRSGDVDLHLIPEEATSAPPATAAGGGGG